MSSTSTPTLAPDHPALADFELVKVIGQGYSGLVYLALERASTRPVALKVVNKGKGNDSRMVSEQDIQRSLSDSPFVLPLLASWHDTDNFYLVSPFCGGHDMSINLAVEGRFSEDRARFYTAELLVALEEMKSRKVLHRDIKPANIVFTAQGHIRLVDFGFATRLKESPITHYEFKVDPNACSGSFAIHDPDFTSTERVGTPSYMSPDQHLGRPYSFEADLHALGVTIYQMLTGRFPFGHGAQSRDEIFEAVLCEHLVFRPEDKVSPEARDLLARLLERDSKRPAQLEEIIEHPWFAGVRWDRVRTQAMSPPWKPHLSPIPKNISVCTVNEGAPCLPDANPSFTFVSPDFIAMRTRGDESILNRLSRLFSRDQPSLSASPLSPSSPYPIPPASPSEVRTEVPLPLYPPASSRLVVPSDSMSTSSGNNPPPTPPPNIPLPPLPTTVTTFSKPSPSPRPLQAQSNVARGDLPPLHIRQQLMKRAPLPSKPRPLRGDMTMMPQVLITPADDDEETPTDAPPSLRLPLGDITNQRLLSPSDAERPAFNPVLKPGPRIKLSAPPKRVKRAHKGNKSVDKENGCADKEIKSVGEEIKFVGEEIKSVGKEIKSVGEENQSAGKEHNSVGKENKGNGKENKRAQKESAPPQVQPKAKVARMPPTAVFMLPPKTVPLPLVMPTSAPLQTPKKTAVKLKNAAQPAKSSPPKSATPKVKPAFKVPVKVAESKLDTPRSSVRKHSTAKSLASPASPVSTRLQVDLSNSQEAVYPRPLIRAESLHHPALAFADAKEKPADYPRPPESISKSKQVVSIKPLSIEEAFALPPPSPPRSGNTPRNVTPALTFTSTPQPYRVPTLSSRALSKQSIPGFHVPSYPPINLDPQDFEQRHDESARSFFDDTQDGPYLSAHAASPPITIGPHYAGYLPGPSSTGILTDLRRLWIRLSMAVSRAISWVRYRGEPGFKRI